MVETITAAQTARRLGVTRAVVARWCARGYITHCRVGPEQIDKMKRDRRIIKVPVSEVEMLVQWLPRRSGALLDRAARMRSKQQDE